MLNSRRVARELALLTMAQVTARADGSSTGKWEAPAIGEMLGRAADMLAFEARDRLQEAASHLVRSEHTVHKHYLHMHEDVLNKTDVEEILEALATAQEAVELVGSAMELPALVALAGADEVRTFTLSLVTLYVDHRKDIDRRLDEAAKNWSVERMASVDRDLMRLAIGELLFSAEVPVEVIINEAVELAKKYGTPDSGRFVNGVLSRFADEGATLRGNKAHVV